jgi:beta-glucosidase
MAQATFHFPRGFLWGTATSSHQVEGNNTNNNWWDWEHQPGKILHDQKSGLACDWWGGRWKEDFDRAAEAGQNAHRLSIEWSRVQPAPDRWDEHALDYYREMLRGLLERNMTPMITLHHFTDPQWLSEKGGWEQEDTVNLFESYVIKVVEAFKEYATYWVTVNEPNVLATNGYLFGEFPPGKRNLTASARVVSHLLQAHAAAYAAIHKIQPQAWVGIALNFRGFQPAKPWFPLDRLVAAMYSRIYNDSFPRTITDGVLRLPFFWKRLPQVRDTQDFLGLNYYTQDQVAFNLSKPKEFFGHRFYDPRAELSDTGFIANQSRGMFEAIKWGLQFKIPIIITENGVEDADDHLRPKYLAEHIHQVWRAVNFTWPVKGYFHWTLVDNFEWERGWTQRFGLWGLDPETQVRHKRPSADFYAEICQENGLSSDMVAKYAPELLESMFPG